jgi:phosphoenolpyruvate-protein phosphotransferase (PTS system enzyme I)
VTFSLHGVAVSRGVAIGRVHVVERNQLEIAEYRLTPDEVDGEVARLFAAVSLAKQHLRAVREHIPVGTPNEIAAFIDTHLLMLDDAAFTDEPARLIRDQHCNAEWAVKLQRDTLVAVFEQMDDAYLRTRKDDVDNVVDRIMRNLLQHAPLRHEVPDQKLKGMIIVAPDLTPADLVLMRHHGVAGFVTEYGGPTSHVSILARSFALPGVVGLHHARRYIEEDEMLIVDGEDGVVVGAADERILQHYRARQNARREYVAALRVLRGAPTVTRDGITVTLHANIEFPSDFVAVRDAGADGVGLYRTEFLFLDRARYPDEDHHLASYRAIMQALDGIPITIRTADLGADKDFSRPGGGGAVAPNPALGLRAVRLCLREPALFWPQVRAIVRASAYGPVRMMIPMLSTLDEVHQVQAVLKAIRSEFSDRGVPFDPHMPVGGMIEVPAAAVCADVFARELDFLSIGTNDLIQYAVAIDRLNDEVSYLYDPLNPGVLRLVRMTLEAGLAAGVPVAMCGEMAGDPRFTRLLLGLGLREFSVHPSVLLEIKQIINTTVVADAEPLARELLDSVDGARRHEVLDALDGGEPGGSTLA